MRQYQKGTEQYVASCFRIRRRTGVAETLPNLEREPTLVGVDNDDNGIGDDVERYIDNNYFELDQKQAVEQYVKHYSKL
ncbi:hypothetical protein OK016_21055 [Vibrio chagasii]|nr:hypothetical protein [Vibrio chagasii]